LGLRLIPANDAGLPVGVQTSVDQWKPGITTIGRIKPEIFELTTTKSGGPKWVA
jgi:hypothetical protein